MPDEPNTGTVEAPQQDGGQPAPDTTQAPPAQDGQALDRILTRVNEIGDQVQQWQQAQPDPNVEPEPDDIGQILQSLGYDPNAEPDWTQQDAGQQPEEFTLTPQDFAQAVMQAAQQAVQSELAQTVHPHLAAQNEAALETAFVDLEGRYPKLLDEEWQGKVLDTAEQLAQQQGSADWLEDPTLIELVHKSLLADELAAQETPVAGTDPGLESPRGANPAAGDESDQERADRIVAAGPNQALRDAGWFG